MTSDRQRPSAAGGISILDRQSFAFRLVEDYSIVALVRGLNPAKSVLILAGTTTIGTQAAVEFVCQQNSLEELLRRLKVPADGELQPFEAVLGSK